MISFKNLGKFDRLGNQLFQYAFTRTTAERLGVPFFCPRWLGDEVFLLGDEKQRAASVDPEDTPYSYRQKKLHFDENDLRIQDGTEIYGFFQSEKYFDHGKVRQWFTFKPEVISSAQHKYRRLDFSKCTGVHLRFGDMKHNIMFVIAPLEYYRKALSILKRREKVLVFSDEIETAKQYLAGAGRDLMFMEGNKDYEDLYLMSRCHDFVCSVSTLSWWGAWLNPEPDKTVVTVKEWIRPGHPLKSPDLCCPGWVALRTCRFLWDDYRWLKAKPVWAERLEKIRGRGLKGNLESLKNFLKNKLSVGS